MQTIKQAYFPHFNTTITLPKYPKITYRADHDPREDIIDDDYTRDTGPEEINDPTPVNDNRDDYDAHIHYDTITTNKKIKSVKYHCEHNVDDIDDRGVIEIPADNDTVIYQDEDGQYYEIPTSDLIEYDGNDGEITYHSKAMIRVMLNLASRYKAADKIPPIILAKEFAKTKRNQTLIRNAKFSVRQYN